MRHRRFLLLLALLTGLIGALCAVSLAFFADSQVVVSFWPANALALAFLLRAFRGGGERAIALGAVFAVLVATSLAFGGHALTAVGFAAGNVVEIAVAVWLLRSLALPLKDEGALLRLFGAAVVAGPIASSLVAGLTIGLDRGWGASVGGALQWLVCDAVAMAVFVPAFLSVRWANPFQAVKAPALLPALGAQLLVALVTTAVFTLADKPLIFLISPCMVLAVWTGRAAGGAAAVAVMAVIAGLMTALGLGPIVQAEHAPAMQVVGLELFTAAQIFTVHPLALALSRLDGFAREAEALRLEAERRSDVRAKLLAHVSHEIRSPLSGVIGLAELMQNGALGELTPAQKDGMSQITDCAADMQALASDLLDAAAVQSGRMKVEMTTVEVSDAMYQAVAGARFRTREFAPRIELTGDWSGRLLVHADPQRLKQVLINLLVNAAKYGGRPPRVEIGAHAMGSRVRIEVSDNGRGVPADLRESLFTPFERLGAEKSDVEGSGLGLAVARELVQLQGGVIGVEDGPLGGARFFVELLREGAQGLDAEAA
jgi:signal transduction histidine kinase